MFSTYIIYYYTLIVTKTKSIFSGIECRCKYNLINRIKYTIEHIGIYYDGIRNLITKKVFFFLEFCSILIEN